MPKPYKIFDEAGVYIVIDNNEIYEYGTHLRVKIEKNDNDFTIKTVPEPAEIGNGTTYTLYDLETDKKLAMGKSDELVLYKNLDRFCYDNFTFKVSTKELIGHGRLSYYKNLGLYIINELSPKIYSEKHRLLLAGDRSHDRCFICEPANVFITRRKNAEPRENMAHLYTLNSFNKISPKEFKEICIRSRGSTAFCKRNNLFGESQNTYNLEIDKNVLPFAFDIDWGGLTINGNRINEETFMNWFPQKTY